MVGKDIAWACAVSSCLVVGEAALGHRFRLPGDWDSCLLGELPDRPPMKHTLSILDTTDRVEDAALVVP